ncbi:MAG TPA: UDP-N-acetylmuramoyl-tripeptide--D-alanyl-D-alanine ligase [Candidatus Paceibacterota bacterium]|nr:UDP-N-acetylmuramoyl-tripeptide--D-alanyl-D-alanine ligase [Candidatus Paceibacterota bacterium]
MKSIIKKVIINILTIEAKLVLKKYKPKIVGVTGSVGKTSTKDAIYTALSTEFHVRKTMKSFNSEIGIPLTILGLPTGWSSMKVWISNIFKGLMLIFKKSEYPAWLVLEIGADRPGDIERIMKWVKLDIAVFTRIGKVPVHVEFYKSVAEVVKEKSNLLHGLKSDGTVILNADDEDVVRFKDLTSAKCVQFSIKEKADVSASYPTITYDEKGAPTGMGFKVDIEGSSFPVILHQALGNQHVYPILAAFAAAHTLKLNLIKVADAFLNHELPPGRMNIIAGKNNSTIIDDTYNASPLAVEEGIRLVDSIETKAKKIAILGDMLELGKHSVEEHMRLGALAAGVFDKVIAVGIRSKDFLLGAKNKKMSDKNIMWYGSSLEAKNDIEKIVKAGDIVYVKGSQGARMERIVEVLMNDPAGKSELLVRQEEEWLNR